MTRRMPDRDADLEVTIYGEASGKGSSVSIPARRGDGSIIMFRTKKGKMMPKMIHKQDAKGAGAWASSVAQATGERMAELDQGMIAKGVPVVVEMTFYRPRNAGHFGTGRNSDLLKSSAPAVPVVRPDIDKLERAVLDALKGVAWHDDGQVAGTSVWKDFGEPARLELRLWALPATVGDVTAAGVEGFTPQHALFG